ncbi:hypothetical protein [Vibrio phage ICP3]|uniref:Uncharacterized protein orf2 n=1 Tax=Vibrio phage ICP3 TaxID=979535 RepID=F1CZZ8_9CAUD|nr:hypothetical protein ViPhICP3_gp02 [Vibrio phage ICP3]ADX87442.1 hypothetical protein [Vibrio phage ICP3]
MWSDKEVIVLCLVAGLYGWVIGIFW